MSLYTVARDTGEALYAQIARHLEQELAKMYSPGDCLPSENDLAARFGVNRHTLRRAIDELVDLGLLERRHGRGVYVLETQLEYRIEGGTRFTETLAALGFQTNVRILRKQSLPAIERVAGRLGIQVGDPVFWIETLRTAEERPLCVISHFIPAGRFPEVMANYEGGSLHALFGKPGQIYFSGFSSTSRPI
ncbi:MAG: phosphonate metabolism transcriptional regulator PhnF [Thermodesulfobacteriota bacterium]|nr:phosphonate metabolism transcriptional regulator PhnF [Thermodesulfobacteriota bacterium]